MKNLLPNAAAYYAAYNQHHGQGNTHLNHGGASNMINSRNLSWMNFGTNTGIDYDTNHAHTPYY